MGAVINPITFPRSPEDRELMPRFLGAKGLRPLRSQAFPDLMIRKQLRLMCLTGWKMVTSKQRSAFFCSEDKPIPINLDSLEELRSKHLRQPPDRPITPMETPLTPFQNSEEEVRMHIRSFPAGSSSGPDGLRPQQLLDLTNCKETVLN